MIQINYICSNLQQLFRRLPTYLFFSIFLLLIISCAQVVTPSGGKRDAEPPQLISVKPENQSTNFSEKKIVFRFNEFVALKDLSNQLIVSPPFKNQPEAVVKGKSLILKLNDTLKSNTTYNIQFGNSIADITEGNISPNIQYAFSTGNEIDTLSVSGKLEMADLSSIEKDVLVMIYGENKYNKDSLASKVTPDYFCKSESNGNYKINNIKKGKYKIVALKDLNSNYLYDSHEELIAFKDTIINIENNVSNFNLKLFKAEPFVQFVKSELKGEYLKTGVIYNKPCKAPNIKFIQPLLKSNDDYFTEISRTSDTLFIFFKKIYPNDTLTYEVLDGNKIIDTVYFQNIKFNQIKKVKGQREPKPFQVKANTSLHHLLNERNIQLIFNYPITSYNLKKSLLINRKDTFQILFKPAKDSDRIFISDFKFQEDSNYQLLLLPNTFKSIDEKLVNDTFRVNFNYPKYEDAGRLYINVVIPKGNSAYIIELKNESKVLLQTFYCVENTKLDCGLLQPGNYFLDAIEDKNGNKKYDTGNYFKNIQPERILRFNKSISVKPMWDLEEEWILEN